MRYADAREKYLAAIQADRSLIYPYTNLGLDACADGRLEDAEAFYAKARRAQGFRRLWGDLPRVKVLQAWILNRQYQYAEAVRCLKEISPRCKERAEVAQLIGDNLRAQSDFAGAEWEYRVALRLEPDRWEYLNGIGLVRQDRGDYVGSIRMYRQALSSTHNDYLPRTNLAYVLGHIGRMAEAEGELRTAIRESPSRPEPYVTWCRLLYERGRFAQAQKKLEYARKLYARDLDTHWWLALCSLARGDNAAAQAFEDDYNQVAGNDPHGHLVAISILEEQESYLLAREKVRQMMQTVPKSAVAHNEIGYIDTQLHHYSSAIESLKRAITLRGALASAHLNLAELYGSLKKFEKAQREIDGARKLDPISPEPYLTWGRLLAKRDDLMGAEAKYRLAVAKGPLAPSTHTQLGNFLILRGRTKEGSREYERASALCPLRAARYAVEWAAALTSTRRYAEADIVLARAVRDHRDFSPLNVQWGNLFLESGKLDLAIKQYKKAANLEPESPWLWIGYGRAAMASNKLNDAVAYFTRAANLAPWVADAYCYWAEALAKQGEVEGALELAKKAVTTDSLSAFAQLTYGDRLIGKEARAAYLRALRIDPDSAAAYDKIGRTYFDGGNTDLAEAWFLRARKRWPSASWGYLRLGEVMAAKKQRRRAVRFYQQGLKLSDNESDRSAFRVAIAGALREASPRKSTARPKGSESVRLRRNPGAEGGRSSTTSGQAVP